MSRKLLFSRALPGLTSRVCQGRSDEYRLGRGDADARAAVPGLMREPRSIRQPKFKEIGAARSGRRVPIGVACGFNVGSSLTPVAQTGIS
jgi:hypothetical protein